MPNDPQWNIHLVTPLGVQTILPFGKPLPSYLMHRIVMRTVELRFTSVSDIENTIGNVDWIILQAVGVVFVCGSSDFAVKFGIRRVLYLNNQGM